MWFRTIFRRDRQLPEENDRNNMEFTGKSRSYRLLSPKALRQLNRHQLTASRYLPGKASGLRASLRRKPAYAFREHRMYTPGDDIRFVDWKASARQEHIFIKQGEYLKEAMVYLLIDCSASMIWGDPSKQRTVLETVAALGYVGLSNGDRVLIQPMGQDTYPIWGPVSGKGQVPAMLNFLLDIPFSGTLDMSQAIREFKRKQRGGLIFIISDLLDIGNFQEILSMLPAPTWDVVVLQLLHPEELEPRKLGDFQMVDIEAGRARNHDVDSKAIKLYVHHLRKWLNDLEMICIERNAFYTLISSGWSLDEGVIPHLRAVKVLNPT